MASVGRLALSTHAMISASCSEGARRVPLYLAVVCVSSRNLQLVEAIEVVTDMCVIQSG